MVTVFPVEGLKVYPAEPTIWLNVVPLVLPSTDSVSVRVLQAEDGGRSSVTEPMDCAEPRFDGQRLRVGGAVRALPVGAGVAVTRSAPESGGVAARRDRLVQRQVRRRGDAGAGERDGQRAARGARRHGERAGRRAAAGRGEGDLDRAGAARGDRAAAVVGLAERAGDGDRARPRRARVPGLEIVTAWAALVLPEARSPKDRLVGEAASAPGCTGLGNAVSTGVVLQPELPLPRLKVKAPETSPGSCSCTSRARRCRSR